MQFTYIIYILGSSEQLHTVCCSVLQCVAVCVAAYIHYIFGSSEPLQTVFVGDEEFVRGAGSSAQVCVCMCVCVWKRLLQCVAVCCSVLR